jgi:hypothetical protein
MEGRGDTLQGLQEMEIASQIRARSEEENYNHNRNP